MKTWPKYTPKAIVSGDYISKKDYCQETEISIQTLNQFLVSRKLIEEYVLSNGKVKLIPTSLASHLVKSRGKISGCRSKRTWYWKRAFLDYWKPTLSNIK